jgi:predicted DNA-binding protein
MPNTKKGYTIVTLQLLDEQAERLKEQAKKKGVTRSEHIRSALHPYINKSREF